MSEAEISLLYDWARSEIDGIDAMAHGGKKRIIKELAAKLEGKIQTESIAEDILTQLRGKVSKSLIYESLDEKYKSAKRAEAQKQAQKAAQEERKTEEKALSPKVDLDKPKQLVATTNSGASVSEPEIKTAANIPEIEDRAAAETRAIAKDIVKSTPSLQSVGRIELYASPEALFAIKHKIDNAVRIGVPSYFMGEEGKLTSFETASERRNKKVMEAKA